MIRGRDTNSRVWTHRHIIIWSDKRKHSSPHSILFRFFKTFFRELNFPRKVWKSTKQLIRYRGIFSTGSFFKSIGPQTHLFEKKPNLICPRETYVPNFGCLKFLVLSGAGHKHTQTETLYKSNYNKPINACVTVIR